MAVMIGAAVAIGGSLISGFFGSQSEKKKIKAQEKMNMQNNQFQAYRDDVNYKRQLAERLYKEQAWDTYSPGYKGTQTYARPVMTDPNSVVLNDPYATKPKKK